MHVKSGDVWAVVYRKEIFPGKKRINFGLRASNARIQIFQSVIVKSVSGTDLSDFRIEKNLYSEIERTIKKEYVSNRDDW